MFFLITVRLKQHIQFIQIFCDSGLLCFACLILLKKGKKFKIKAKLQSKQKVSTHIAKFRYESSNTKIATVDKNGNVKAKKKGTVTIYVYAQNGLCKTVKIKVK